MAQMEFLSYHSITLIRKIDQWLVEMTSAELLSSIIGGEL